MNRNGKTNDIPIHANHDCTDFMGGAIKRSLS